MSQTHLLNRKGVYYYHRRVPLPLVKKLGKKVILFSLGTTDLKQAKKRRALAELKWDAQFDALEQAPLHQPTANGGQKPSHGGFCRTSFRRGRQSIITCAGGSAKAYGIECITCSSWQIASGLRPRPDHRLLRPCWRPPGARFSSIEQYAGGGGNHGPFLLKWREEIPPQPKIVGLWKGENGCLRTAKHPILECPLLAQSGRWLNDRF